MPVTCSIDSERRRVTCLGTGIVTGEDLAAAQRSLVADPAFVPSHALLFDLATAEHATVTAADLQRLADLTPFAPTAYRVVLVSKPLLYGLSRMFQAIAGERAPRILVTSDRAEAEAWLERAKER